MKKSNIEFNNSDNTAKMKTISKKELIEFLVKKPLYSKLLVTSNYGKGVSSFSNPNDYKDLAFKIKCPIEKEVQTFKTELANQEFAIMNLVHSTDFPIFFDKESKSMNLTLHLIATCHSCGAKADFLLKLYSDKTWNEREKGIKIFVKKIGQFPPYEISPEATVEKYLLEEDKGNYKKALANLSIGYGIGAFAYFRRIIENEIIRLIEDISKLDFDGVEHIEQALKTYETDHAMAKLIDVATKFLPNSLLSIGDNPIRLLHEQLSVGLHKLPDEVCIGKAETIDTILKYVIKKVNEEKYQLKDVKEAMKKLRIDKSNN